MKSYCMVGTGSRAIMFRDAFMESFRETAQILAICDRNPGRLELLAEDLRAVNPDLKCYEADGFDQMLKVHQPDAVIVCTMDSTHDEYVCRALEFGCDVITEKPMTIDEKRCQRIVDTVQRTGRSVRVTFNYRYSPVRSQVKELLMEGIIGRVLSVEFQYLLDTNHGADYYRRWHRNKDNSGGLLVHKATHHFDLVNWWIGSEPKTVYANGDRVFYTEEQAKRCGLQDHSDRCLDCPVKDRCNFYLDIASMADVKARYLDNEKYDGYYRDRCVFSPEIDIEDTMNVVVQYNSGTFMSYSLNSFSPWEGYQIAFNGTKGRLEHSCRETSYINGDGSVQGAFQPNSTTIRIYPHFKTPYQVKVREGVGGHGGGDEVMLNDIFGQAPADPLLRSADYVQGAYSILTGIAANHSIARGEVIQVADLVTGLGNAGYPQNRAMDDTIPFVAETQRV
ncbi:MAG: Gfo/Idh/MocA family oxidoreductase [Sedimentisphaerales bacterium]|nr:Gfo/Idh/MocA family oxidoreductase [Sedimentisphaerales bacterium]